MKYKDIGHGFSYKCILSGNDNTTINIKVRYSMFGGLVVKKTMYIYDEKFTPSHHKRTKKYNLKIGSITVNVDIDYPNNKGVIKINYDFGILGKKEFKSTISPNLTPMTLVCNATYIDKGIYEGTDFEKGDEHTYVKCVEDGKFFKCCGSNRGNKYYDKNGDIVNYDHGDGTVDHRTLLTTTTYCYDDVKSLNTSFSFTRIGKKNVLHEGSALMVYLCEGVCHQAANRFLYFGYPFGNYFIGSNDVNKPRGWSLSCLIFGVWGRDGIGKAMFEDNYIDVRIEISRKSDNYKKEYPFAYIAAYWATQVISSTVPGTLISMLPPGCPFSSIENLNDILKDLFTELGNISLKSKTSIDLCDGFNKMFEVFRQNVKKLPDAKKILGDDYYGDDPIILANYKMFK